MTDIRRQRLTQLQMKNSYLTKLILSVKARPCLYDDQDQQFGDEVLYNKAWDDVLDCKDHEYSDGTETVVSIKETWAKCRKNFSTERSRRKDRSSTNGGWPLYNLMSFMDKHIATRVRKRSKAALANGLTKDVPSIPKDVSDHDVENLEDCDAAIEPSLENSEQSSGSQLENSKEQLDAVSVSKKPQTKPSNENDDPNIVESTVEFTAEESSDSGRGQKRFLEDVNDEGDCSNLKLKHIKLLRHREMIQAKSERLAQTKQKAVEEARRLRDLEYAAQQQKNEEKLKSQEETNINKAFADFVFATLDTIKDDDHRREKLEEITSILYMKITPNS